MARRVSAALAVLFAGVGGVFAWRAISPASERPPAEHRRAGPGEGSPGHAARAAGSSDSWFGNAQTRSRLVTPTPETIDDVVATAVARARREARPALGFDSEWEEALAEAFGASLRHALAPDFEAYQAWIARLGGETPYLAGDGVATEYRRAIESQSRATAFAPVAPEAVRVRARFIRGEPVPPDPAFGEPLMTLRHTSMFDIPQDAERAGLDVIEALIPITLPSTEDDGRRSDRRLEVAMGFGYAWSPDRSAWIPWRIWVYGAGQEVIPPNFP
ncbi:MAG: hypothetical protein D6693_07105 [Planctomycetota bacterium]|nr:MAG: hypothetical protein D6693_07105 [Planctomycetota bacterium]